MINYIELEQWVSTNFSSMTIISNSKMLLAVISSFLESNAQFLKTSRLFLATAPNFQVSSSILIAKTKSYHSLNHPSKLIPTMLTIREVTRQLVNATANALKTKANRTTSWHRLRRNCEWCYSSRTWSTSNRATTLNRRTILKRR